MKTEKTKKGLRSILILSILAILLVFPGHGLAYQANTHKWIAEQAIQLAQIPELDDSIIENTFVTGAYQADYQLYNGTTWVDDWQGEFAPRDHFWNPDTGEALWSELGTLWTADAKAFEYWEKAHQQYVLGNTLEAYKFLGHVAHLLADMSVPAHVHIDPHIEWWVIRDGDTYETYMESFNYTRWSSYNAKMPPYDLESRSALFYKLAQIAQNFPSDDRPREGDPSNTPPKLWDPGDLPDTTGWKASEHLLEIGNYLLPRSIEYTAALLRLFHLEFNYLVESRNHGFFFRIFILTSSAKSP